MHKIFHVDYITNFGLHQLKKLELNSTTATEQ